MSQSSDPISGADYTGATSREYYDREVEYDTETRRSFATTEFWVFVVLTVALLFFTYESGRDSLSREEGWRYAAALGIGYMISRGLAKAGSAEHYTRDR